jgi:glycosyltransferase involved in cell wall biosynthesis
MRIAIVHDWLVVSGGAEKVTRELLRAFPTADLFALMDKLSATDRAFILDGRRASTTFVQHLPFVRTHYRWYLPFFPRAIEGLDLSAHDLIISASYAVAKGVRKRPDAVHVCYLHTPMRYAWVDPEGYLQDHGMAGIQGRFVRRQLERLRAWDLRSNAGVDRFVANGKNVAERVERHYGRTADVLLPPVDDALFMLSEGERSHFIAAARLVPYKRMDRIIEAFRSLPEQTLLVCGDGPEREHLMRSAPLNVRVLGHVEHARFAQLLSTSKALVCAADEDLGLTPLEAQACGTPVIALRKGGYLESVQEGISGIFFEEASPEGIASGIRHFLRNGVQRSSVELREGVRPFFAGHFRSRMQYIVEEALEHHHART